MTHDATGGVRSRVTIDGRALEVLELPAASGTPGNRAPLVLLHEGLGSVGLWRDFPARLARRTGRRVVAFSRHGHGHSQPPPRPRTPAFFHTEANDVLPALLAATGTRAPILVGHSDGGSIALIHGAGHELTGIVTLAAHVFVEPITVASIEAIRERYREGDLRGRMARHHDDPDAAFHGWCDVWLDPAFVDWTLDAEIAGISTPTLVIQGTGDAYGTLAQVDRICAAVGASAERRLVPGGHSPHLEAADEVTEAIGAFCAPLP